MRLNSIGESTATSASLASRKTNGSAQKPTLQGDQLAMGDSEALSQTMRQTASVRPDKVAQARALIADNSYPSKAQIGQMADLLARNIKASL